MHCTLLQVLFLSLFKTYTKELSFFEGKINRCQNYACLFKYKILPWTTSIMMCDVLTLQFLIKHSQLNFYKSYIKTYTKYQSCIKNIFNIKKNPWSFSKFAGKPPQKGGSIPRQWVGRWTPSAGSPGSTLGAGRDWWPPSPGCERRGQAFWWCLLGHSFCSWWSTGVPCSCSHWGG